MVLTTTLQAFARATDVPLFCLQTSSFTFQIDLVVLSAFIPPCQSEDGRRWQEGVQSQAASDMSTPFLNRNGSTNVTAHCTLLQQLSQVRAGPQPAVRLWLEHSSIQWLSMCAPLCCLQCKRRLKCVLYDIRLRSPCWHSPSPHVAHRDAPLSLCCVWCVGFVGPHPSTAQHWLRQQ